MSFLFKWLAGKSAVCGIDLGSSSIKITQIDKTSSGYQLTKLAVAPTLASTFKDGNIVDAQILADSLRATVASNKIASGGVVGAVSGQSVVIRPINMARMSEKELQNAIRFEAERYLPYPVAESRIYGSILRPSIDGDEKSMEVLLVAAPNDLVKSTQDVLHLAGLQVQAIDIEPFALVRALQITLDEAIFNKTVVLLNIGASYTSISIFKGGYLRHNRTVTVAGNTFTKAISQSLNLNLEEAEKIKKEKGMIRVEKDTTPIAPTTMRIFNVIVPVLNELLTEVQRSFDYYRSRYRGETIDQIVLCGGTSRFKNLDTYISSELGVPCIVANPFKNLSVGDIPGISGEELQAMAPELMVSIGLSLRDLVVRR